jgi:hypothetical protein
MDPQRMPLLAAMDGGQSRDSSWRHSDGERLGLGSLGSLEEGVAQLSSVDRGSSRCGNVHDHLLQNDDSVNTSHSFTTSASLSQQSPTSNIGSYQRLLPTSQQSKTASPASTARTEASSSSNNKLSQSSLSDFFRHRNTETYLADPSVQNLASMVFGADPEGASSSPVSQAAASHQHSRKMSMPWRFLSSPIRNSEDNVVTGNNVRMADSSPIAASGLPNSSRSRRSLSEAKHRFLDGLPGARNITNPVSEELAVAGAVSDEGRMVAHDSGSMTLNARARRNL